MTINPTKRIPMMVTTRCMLNGAEMKIVLYLRPDQDPVAIARKYWPRREREFVRGIVSRTATVDEIEAHKARIAAIMT